jgi:signal transduction histidine kinase
MLALGRVRRAPGFEPLEVASVEVFASATAAAIELAEVRSELERHGIVAEDERIARDLHDTVIQQLFAIGLAMQWIQRMASGVLRERIEAAVTDLDAVIGGICTTIFALPARSASATGVRE